MSLGTKKHLEYVVAGIGEMFGLIGFTQWFYIYCLSLITML